MPDSDLTERHGQATDSRGPGRSRFTSVRPVRGPTALRQTVFDRCEPRNGPVRARSVRSEPGIMPNERRLHVNP
jgi:hypothetical protein